MSGMGWVSIALGIAIHCLYIASQVFFKVIIQRCHDFMALTVSCILFCMHAECSQRRCICLLVYLEQHETLCDFSRVHCEQLRILLRHANNALL